MNEPYLIDAQRIGDYQECRRKFLLGEDWMMARWKPRSLFDSCLRKAIFRMSTQGDVKAAVDEAQFNFMQLAANPGLDTKYDPYRISKDYCSMLATVIHYLERVILLKLRRVPDVMMSSSVSWRVSSWADDSGQLHRWVIASDWDEKDLPRELHGWRTMGDLVVTRQPMMLHVLEVGRSIKGRPYSPWVRGFRHPTMPTLKVRFKRSQGQDFNGWHPVWLSDTRHDVKEWVELMLRDKITEDIVHHYTVNVPADEVCDSAVQQIISESMAMREMVRDRDAIRYDLFPMSRNACDSISPCPYQNVCYVDKPVDIGELGLYKSRSVLSS